MFFLERLAEMRGIDVAAEGGDFLEGEVGGAEEIGGAFEAGASEKEARGEAVMAAEEAGEMGGAEGVVGGDLRDAEGVGEVEAKVVGGGLDAVELAGIEAGARCARRR